jgi:hypothetical protein
MLSRDVMLRLALAFTVVVGLLAPAVAAPPKADPDPKSLEVPLQELSKARELVQKLGSDTYTEREAAERELAKMGRLARPELLNGVNLDPDPEIRARCSVLLPKANAEEMKARLDAFMADAENKYEHDLPGWHKLRAVVRGEWKVFGWTYVARPDADKAARELFIEFMQIPSGRKLLAHLDGPPEDLGRAVATHKQDLFNAKYSRVPGQPARNPSVAEIAVVIFADSQVGNRHVGRTSLLTSIISTSSLPSLLRGTDARAAALQALMTAWFDSRTEPMEMYSALSLANSMQNNDAACRLAARMMATPGLQGFYKGQALTTLVRLKAVDQLSSLEKAFNDATVLTTTFKMVNGKQVRQSIEVRDAALAAALVMTGQDPADYGFDAFPKNAGNLNFAYTWARISEEKRTAAFFKYGWKQLKDNVASTAK